MGGASKFQTTSRYGLALLFALAPLAMNAVWLAVYHNTSLLHQVPFGSDSLDYWLEIGAFIRAGFGSGYFGYEELHAPFGASGAHGVWYPMFIAAFGKVFGWHLYSVPIFQATFLGLSILCFCAIARPTVRQMLFLLCFCATYPPIIFWQAHTMQETLHFSVAVLLAGLTYRLLVQPSNDSVTLRFRILFLAVVTVASMMRISWVVFFLIYFMVFSKHKVKGFSVAVVKFFVTVALVHMVGFKYFKSPYPYDLNTPSSLISLVFQGNFEPYLTNLFFNLHSLFRELKTDPSGYLFILRYQIIAFVPAVVAGYWLCKQELKSITTSPRINPAAWAAVHALALIGILMLMLLLYSAEGIFVFKLAAPLFVFSVLLAALSLPLRWLWLLVAINILSWPSALGYLQMGTEISYDQRGRLQSDIHAFSKQTQGFIQFTPNASPWCNTLIINQYPHQLLGLPPGIAVNFILNYEKFSGKLKSRYILVPSGGNLEALSKIADLLYLVSTEAGDLYLNKLADCPTVRSVQPGSDP